MRLMLSFSLITLLVITGCFSFINRVSSMDKGTHEISASMHAIDINRHIQTNFLEIRNLLLLSLDDYNADKVSEYKKQIEILVEEDNRLMEEYSNSSGDWISGEKELFEQLK